MTTNSELAIIQKVDLREIWPNEAADFTPWLSENIERLGDELGLDLEVEAREASVGGYSLDILARDSGRDRPVVIENQLESTDHTHLGQLLTYAGGFDASVIVWIAKEFRDEHREAMDFLNRHTSENTQFFGVVVELWKIDDSRPAANFDLVVAPNEWRRGISARSQPDDDRSASPRQEKYRSFFQALLDTLREEHRFTRARRAGHYNFHRFSAGPGITYRAALAARNVVQVEVYIDSDDGTWNDNLFEQLMEQKESIESELGEPLDWDGMDGRRACRVSVKRPGSIDDAPEALAEIRAWMIDRLLKFREALGPRLEEIAV